MNTDIRVSVEFWEHPKTVKLERRLGLQAVKCLQLLWIWAAQNRPDGDLAEMDEEDIEIAAKWQGEADAFISALVDLRWMDKAETGFLLHDWRDHNPWAADAEERGNKSRLSRLAKINRQIYEQLVKEGCTGVTRERYEELTTVKRPLTTGTSPAPSPSPFPSPKEIPPLPPNGGDARSKKDRRSGKDQRDILTQKQRHLFELFWAAYPKKKSKGDAEKAWKLLNSNEQLVETMISTIGRAKTSVEWTKLAPDGGNYIPYPATWLRVKGWEDVYQSAAAPDVSPLPRKEKGTCGECAFHRSRPTCETPEVKPSCVMFEPKEKQEE